MPRHPRPTPPRHPFLPGDNADAPEPVDWLGERIEPAQDVDPQQPALSNRRDSSRAKGIGQALESRRGSHR